MLTYWIVERKSIILQDKYILCISPIPQKMNPQRMIFRNLSVINTFQQV